MASLTAISTAIKAGDEKTEKLRKAFEDLQAHSSSLASFTLQWKDLEEHYDSIKNSIEERLKVLKSKESQAGDESDVKESPPHNVVSNGKQSVEEDDDFAPTPELVSLCAKMDAKGLWCYILERRKELPLIRDEVAIALKSAPDPPKLIFDAMQCLYSKNRKRDKLGELAAIKACVFLLEQQTAISAQVKPQVKEKAKKLAIEWKGKLNSSSDPLETLAFLQLLATYDLACAFREDELLDLVLTVARRRQAIDLCRALGFTEKMPDFIQKLTSKGKHLEAVKFIFAFELAGKFPPVPLLKTHVKQSKKIGQEIRQKGNYSIQSQNEASAREVTALRAVMKLVDEHDLESQYPCENLEKRIELLEKMKADRKRNETSSNKKQSGSKRPRQSSPADSPRAATPKTVPRPSSTVPQIPQTQLQPSSLLQDRVAPYFGSAAGPYGLGGPSSVSPYLRTSSELYGVGANPLSFGGHLSPPRSHLYSSESHPSGLYDRSSLYGGYGLPPPQHRPLFFP
ncbi:truncated FRIGIDA-like protein 1 [Macadamia integrifolia]|uniref:truncated FRIGIDA-like protein 1 n=1 Tax=Macadamia integrifolia TaxID=60698 RepID=UPI001C4F4C69|nr:truncated FRIGIDA-like protein 1 [Macadamia integrifolia]